jgi:TPR repeat protein
VENDAFTLFARASALAGQADDADALKQAFCLFSRAAQQGDGKSLEALAVMLENGQGVCMAPERAAELYGLAWQDGLPSAAHRLGCMIAEGRARAEYEPQDRDEAALELFSDAAALGQTEAMVALGNFKAKGRGGLPDLKAAKALYRIAGLRGAASASLALGNLLVSEGEIAQGWAWLALAQRQNLDQKPCAAADRRSQLEATMQADCLIEGYTCLLELESLWRAGQD